MVFILNIQTAAQKKFFFRRLLGHYFSVSGSKKK
jgi:hypothetical protein